MDDIINNIKESETFQKLGYLEYYIQTAIVMILRGTVHTKSYKFYTYATAAATPWNSYNFFSLL